MSESTYFSKNWTLLALCVSTASVVVFLIHKINLAQTDLEEMRKLLEKERELRQVERKGRISSQVMKRNEIQEDNMKLGYRFMPIGVIESPFPDRRGTPRQPNLVRSATGKIRFNKKIIQREHFNEIKEFSHVWVLWVFHENTNADAKALPAKIKPPRLHGSKVGCLSTRSPHRPNPIGLSVISVGADFIEIACVDMVDGTPVLDVKPYIPYDIIPSSLPLPMSAVDEFGVPIPPTPLRVPAWIHEADIPLRQITYSDQAYLDLESVFQSEETGVRPRHSSSARDLMLLISQVLRQDIRSHHQGRSSNSAEVGSDAVCQDYECRLDTVTVKFTTHSSYITINRIIPQR